MLPSRGAANLEARIACYIVIHGSWISQSDMPACLESNTKHSCATVTLTAPYPLSQGTRTKALDGMSFLIGLEKATPAVRVALQQVVQSMDPEVWSLGLTAFKARFWNERLWSTQAGRAAAARVKGMRGDGDYPVSHLDLGSGSAIHAQEVHRALGTGVHTTGVDLQYMLEGESGQPGNSGMQMFAADAMCLDQHPHVSANAKEGPFSCI